jgi:hypothetical protein
MEGTRARGGSRLCRSNCTTCLTRGGAPMSHLEKEKSLGAHQTRDYVSTWSLPCPRQTGALAGQQEGSYELLKSCLN